MSPKNQGDSKFPKFLFGGNFGLQFGTYTSINLSPQVGLYATDWLMFGVGADYTFVSQKNLYSFHVIGGNLFVQPRIFKRILLHAEYEYQYVIQKDFYSGIFDSFRNHNVIVGAGYRQYISDKVSLYALVLITVYSSYWVNDYYPFFRIGINVDI